MNFSAFTFFIFVSLTAVFLSADEPELTQAEVEHFLKVSLFEPRVDQFIDNTLAMNKDLTKKLSKKKLDELRSKWRKQLIAEYQSMTRETFNREELKNLGDYFASPICLKWQVFSDTAYSRGRTLMTSDLKELRSSRLKK